MYRIVIGGVDLLELNEVTVLLRLALAVFFGCVLGVERTRKRRAAGMRTFALVCVAASLVMMTSQFINTLGGVQSDPGRMGAQVISGIGFLCAGTIMMTEHHKIMGLTTAASLWAASIIGLAVGSGFYLGAAALTIAVLLLMVVFDGYRERFNTATEWHLYLVIKDKAAANDLLQWIKEMDLVASDLSRAPNDLLEGVAMYCSLRSDKRFNRQCTLKKIREFPSILYLEEV